MLRSMRYGEADRILHLYTPMRGRVGAIAKGVRRTRSRFGGRLEPFSHVDLQLHEGRSDLLTVTGADTVACPRAPARRRRRRSTPPAGHATPSPGCSRSGDPHPEVFHLLVQRAAPARGRARATATLANQLAFRLKLLRRRGLRAAAVGVRVVRRARAPRRASPARRAASSARRARRRRSRSTRERTGSWSRRSGDRSRRRPPVELRALRQVERAITDLAEHHGHIRLRAAAAG